MYVAGLTRTMWLKHFQVDSTLGRKLYECTLCAFSRRCAFHGNDSSPTPTRGVDANASSMISRSGMHSGPRSLIFAVSRVPTCTACHIYHVLAVPGLSSRNLTLFSCAVPSNFDLAGLSDKQRQHVERVQKPELSYARRELVSFPQSRFWFLRLLIEDQTTFNVAFYYRVTGNLRIGDLERAVRLVTNRHESCRTCFVADETEADLAYQQVLPSSLIRLERKKINSVEDIEVEYMAMKATPFDLTSGRLLRLILLTLSATEHYLLFNYHHILMDGVSVQNLLADLEKAYRRQPLGAPPCQLPDFSRRQRVAFENGDFEEEVAYWRSEFPNGDHPVLPLLPMAQAGSRIPTKSFEVHQVGCDLNPSLMARIREASKASRSTTFHFYLAVFKSMLMRLTDVDDLTIGIADANRNDEDAMGVVGLLLNLLTLRFKRDLTQPFHESVAEARTKAYSALANSRVPFDVLLQKLNVRRSSSYSPFFQAFFDYRQGTHWKQLFANTQLELLELSCCYDIGRDAHIVTSSFKFPSGTRAAIGNVWQRKMRDFVPVHS